jgi:hypothetical protein
MAGKIVHACVDMYPDPDWLIADNDVSFLAAPESTLWKPGTTLHVGFLDGDPRVWKKVGKYAAKWCDHANIKFDFDYTTVPNHDAEIRITFKRPGSWSYVGTSCLKAPKAQPTMNYGWLKWNTPVTEYNRVVVHEFGHAIGCIHEHMSPEAKIPWDKPRAYAYYMSTQGWTEQDVDVNLFQLYDESTTRASEFDPTSIMIYPIPNDLTIGDFEVGWTMDLSETDKAFIATLYPKTA